MNIVKLEDNYFLFLFRLVVATYWQSCISDRNLDNYATYAATPVQENAGSLKPS